MNLYENQLYIEDLDYVRNLDLPWEQLSNKRILISGATGLVGSFLVDVLMRKNELDSLNVTVYALCRNASKAESRFSYWKHSHQIKFVYCDINNPFNKFESETIDFVIHLASNTHPIQYSTDPIGTITTNIIGLRNMLDFAVEHHSVRFMFASSNEIYGENRGDVELFDENYCGYINSNTIRAGYPESKRCGEALCQAYKYQKNLYVVIPRLTRSYGPTMLMTDSKAISQFLKKALLGEDIVLKSKGNQYYSYTYVADAVSGLFHVLFKAENGETYNIADQRSDIKLMDLASMIAELAKKKVVFEIPDEIESSGYSKATKARLDGSKIKKLGWKAKYDMKNGLSRTLRVLKEEEK